MKRNCNGHKHEPVPAAGCLATSGARRHADVRKHVFQAETVTLSESSMAAALRTHTLTGVAALA